METEKNRNQSPSDIDLYFDEAEKSLKKLQKKTLISQKINVEKSAKCRNKIKIGRLFENRSNTQFYYHLSPKTFACTQFYGRQKIDAKQSTYISIAK